MAVLTDGVKEETLKKESRVTHKLKYCRYTSRVTCVLTFSDTQGPLALSETHGPIAPETFTSRDV